MVTMLRCVPLTPHSLLTLDQLRVPPYISKSNSLIVVNFVSFSYTEDACLPRLREPPEIVHGRKGFLLVFSVNSAKIILTVVHKLEQYLEKKNEKKALLF